MIYTAKSALPDIHRVAAAIVGDIVAHGAMRSGANYTALAPTLFGRVPLSLIARPASVTDLSVIKAGSGVFGVSVEVGVHRPRGSPVETIITVAGALCQELVHQQQRARDVNSYDMAADVQTAWHAARPPSPLPQEWLVGYYGSSHEFEAHGEQIACEVWVRDTDAGKVPRKSVVLSSLMQSEPLRRIEQRLLWPGPPRPAVASWRARLQRKVDDALASW
jgi:hypothetical protein